MTMPYSPGRALFEGNGTATDFPFSFKVWETDQLSVTQPACQWLEGQSERRRRQRDLSPRRRAPA